MATRDAPALPKREHRTEWVGSSEATIFGNSLPLTTFLRHAISPFPTHPRPVLSMLMLLRGLAVGGDAGRA